MEEWLAKRAETDRENYYPYFGLQLLGHTFPLVQKMSIKTKQPLFGFNVPWGKEAVASEVCCYEVKENIDRKSLEECFGLLNKIADEVPDPYSKLHKYTFISMVLLTKDFNDKELKKQVKKYKYELRYSPKQQMYGWTSCRICVIDFESGEMCWNAMGDSLAVRIGKWRDSKNGIC